MNTSNTGSSKEILKKILQARKLTEKIKVLQSELDSLYNDIYLKITEGESTGNAFLDFALVACDGTYDPLIVTIQYGQVFDLGIEIPHQQIMLVQKAHCKTKDDGIIILRNIFLATLRKMEVGFDVNKLVMYWPVEPKYFAWRESIRDNRFVTSSEIVNEDWLMAGPLYNQYCEYTSTKETEAQSIIVPPDAVCEIELMPHKDKESLFTQHGINSEALSHLYQCWIRGKSKT